MSPVNFEHLAKQNPKYKRAIEQLRAWINDHPQERVLNPLNLRKDIGNVSPAELTMALDLLRKEGLLHRVYKVVTPSGVLAERDFDDPIKISRQAARSLLGIFRDS